MIRGKHIVVDGLDGIGKGVFLDTLEECSINRGKKVFDVDAFCLANNRLPILSEVKEFDVIKVSEPTYAGIGRYIRDVLISKNSFMHKNNMAYHTIDIAQSYSLDRSILLRQLVLPALKSGINVFQSRCFLASIIYQGVTGNNDGVLRDEILDIPGNKFALNNPPNYIIVPIIDDVNKVIERLNNREKKDDAIFENIEFQTKLNREYNSQYVKDLLHKIGSKLIYMDAGKTIEHSKNQVREFYINHLD